MRKFILYTLSLFIIVVIIMYSLDIIYTYCYTNNPVARSKTQYVSQMKGESFDVVFLGNSRVKNHIDVRLIDEITGLRTLNLGMSGVNILDSYLLLQMLSDHNEIKKVYLQVDHKFNLQGPSKMLQTWVLPYLTTNSNVNEYFKYYSDDYWAICNIPFYRYMINAHNIGFREMLSNLLNRPQQNPPQYDFEFYTGAYEETGFALPTEWETKNSDLDKLKQFCAERGIELELFIAPYAPGTPNLDSIVQLSVSVPEIKNYTLIYDDVSYFKDEVHLNETGAKAFTKFIALHDLMRSN